MRKGKSKEQEVRVEVPMLRYRTVPCALFLWERVAPVEGEGRGENSQEADCSSPSRYHVLSLLAQDSPNFNNAGKTFRALGTRGKSFCTGWEK